MSDECVVYNYCGVFLGELGGVDMFIDAVSVGDRVGWANSSNVSIVTFKSIYLINELRDLFITMKEMEAAEEWDNHNFFIMDADKSSIYFDNLLIYERLYEVFDKVEKKPEDDYEVDTMSEDEKDEIINKILDKGSELSVYDQKLLELLTK